MKVIVANPPPTPEEMGKRLGLSPEHIESVRRIMERPAKRKKMRSFGR